MQYSIRELLKKACDNNILRLEAEVLLAHVLKVSRTELHTWPERLVKIEDKEQYDLFMARRINGEPIAYIVGCKEFWSLDFTTTPDVLIPRPETELLVEHVLNHLPRHKAGLRVLDLGTGSGAIAISLAVECPTWNIVAIDNSIKALQLAKINAKNLTVRSINFVCSNWFAALSPAYTFDVIVSNPPYIPKNDVCLQEGDLRFEPISALVSNDQGLQDLKMIIQEAFYHLHSKGWLFLEHGHTQGEEVVALMKKNGYIGIQGIKDLAGINRVVIGYRP